MTTRADILRMLRKRTPGHSLPSRFYNDPAIFALDLQAIFERHWLFVGATCEVAQPGQYLTVSVGETSILVVRGTDGELRAFHNTCRHRGSRICDDEFGRAKLLVCPYHRWGYRLDGTLAHVSHMPENFDFAAHALRPVHLRTVCGTIFICMADEPPDFAPYTRAIEPLLAPHRLDRARVAHKDHLVVEGNWKLMMENSRECYHCATSHRELMRTFLDIYNFDDPQEAAEIRAFCERREAEGLPSHVAEGADFRASRLPFTGGAVSTTMDGRPAVSRLLGDVPHNDIGSLRWVHYPSVYNHALGDYAITVRMLPLDPRRTLVTTAWLVDRDAVEGRDYDAKNLIRVWDDTNRQDAALVRRNQLGVNSAGYVPGPYSPTLEAGVIKFVDWYCARVMEHLAGQPVAARAMKARLLSDAR